jgi:3-isopropylmalate dehydratase small subunit
MTIIEHILAKHAGKKNVVPGEIVNIKIDVRLARDFGGANVIKNIEDNNLSIHDNKSTFFTFDCNPTGSDQKYAANQQKCRIFARNFNIGVYDINAGIGTHLAIDKGLALPGSTIVSTDSHANILGAICAFGQGMGDRDIAAAWSYGKVWFKVPESVRLILNGKRPSNVTAKDIVLNILKEFGANTFLGLSVELYGDEVENLTLDERITISSMATEMGAIIILIPPNDDIIAYIKNVSGKPFPEIAIDKNVKYQKTYEIDIERFVPCVSNPGHPEDVIPVRELGLKKIDSAFIGSCTNGRYEDMLAAAEILKSKKIAPGVVLKIVPATDEIWNKCLKDGLIETFKSAGVLVGNAGCAGCASGQIGQNGPDEVTISTGNRNFKGKQGKGDVYLASPQTVAASAVAGHITTPDQIPLSPSMFKPGKKKKNSRKRHIPESGKSVTVKGRCWLILNDNIDTDMIFHNQHLAITELSEMGQFTFGNLEGFTNFTDHVKPGDIIITGKNFGAGSSRQQAVDCFKALGVQAIIAESFGAIYERNAINAGFPVLTYKNLDTLDLKNLDTIQINFEKGSVTNNRNNTTATLSKFSGVQMEIYQKGDLLLI